MRTRHLFAAILAGAALFACTKENNINPNIVQEDGNAFIKVNIAFADGSITKATEGNYGTSDADEHAIKSIYFAFYDVNGNFVTGTTVGTTEDQITNSDTGDENAEEFKSDIVIALTLTQGQAFPTKMVAYVNAAAGTFANRSLDEAKMLTSTLYRTDDGFIMTNSTYLKDDTTVTACEEEIENPEEIFKETEDEAQKEPGITVHVERLAAKVTVTTPDKDNIYNYEIDEETYLKFNVKGWGLTSTSKEAYYLKNIDPAWTFSWNWNKPEDYRCFWALDPKYKGYEKEDYKYTSYNGCTKESNTADYCLENTLTHATFNEDPAAATHIVIAGTYSVVDKNGDPKDGYEEGADLYLRHGDLYLKDDLLKAFINQGTVYTYDADNQTFTKLTNDDGEYSLVEADANNVTLGFKKAYDATGFYWVRKQQDFPVDDIPKDHYFDSPDGYRYVDYDILYSTDAKYSNELKDLCGTATVYTGGNAYFETPIEHFGTPGNDGEYGVVRNHHYVLNVNSIKGLAKGVFNPDEDIIPQPQTQTYYLSTELHILSWKVVNQEVIL